MGLTFHSPIYIGAVSPQAARLEPLVRTHESRHKKSRKIPAIFGARGGIRTHTGFNSHKALNLACLPISPPEQRGFKVEVEDTQPLKSVQAGNRKTSRLNWTLSTGRSASTAVSSATVSPRTMPAGAVSTTGTSSAGAGTRFAGGCFGQFGKELFGRHGALQFHADELFNFG